jgi:hypothetical protein
VRLDELLGRDGVVEDLGELFDTGLLGLTGTVGKEDVRDLDAELVVSVQDLEHALTLGDQTVTVDKDTVNVEDESHILGGADLLASEILELSCNDVAGWLDRGHARALGSTTAIGVVNGRKPRLPLRAGNGQRGTEGVARSSPLLHGRLEGEVVHVVGGVSHGTAGCWDFDSVLSAIFAVNGDGNVVSVTLGLDERHLVLLGGGRHGE